MLDIQALHHIHLQVADLAGNERFVRDFGLVEAGREAGRVYYRGHGGDAYSYVVEAGPATRIAAIAFRATSAAVLDDAIRLHGATARRALAGPGGGEAVSLVDPDGTVIDIVHGIAPRVPDARRPPPLVNTPGHAVRFNASHPPLPVGPAEPLRLGHLGLFVADFARSEAWYRDVLGTVPSDRMYLNGPDHLVGGFYRLGRGHEWVDHHILGFFAMGRVGLHHMSFEVHGMEQQMMAHRHLQRQGHQPVWGVGRHPLGSHVFDMWKDPNGLRFETFSDTDLCNHERPAQDHPVQGSEMDLWSNDPADRYFA